MGISYASVTVIRPNASSAMKHFIIMVFYQRLKFDGSACLKGLINYLTACLKGHGNQSSMASDLNFLYFEGHEVEEQKTSKGKDRYGVQESIDEN